MNAWLAVFLHALFPVLEVLLEPRRPIVVLNALVVSVVVAGIVYGRMVLAQRALVGFILIWVTGIGAIAIWVLAVLTLKAAGLL